MDPRTQNINYRVNRQKNESKDYSRGNIKQSQEVENLITCGRKEKLQKRDDTKHTQIQSESADNR